MPPLISASSSKYVALAPLSAAYYIATQAWIENAGSASNISLAVASDGSTVSTMGSTDAVTKYYVNIARRDPTSSSMFSMKTRLASGRYGQVSVQLDTEGNTYFQATLPDTTALILTKYGPTGAVVWARQFTLSGYTFQPTANALKVLPDGDLLATGMLMGTGGVTSYRGFVMRISHVTGSIVWQKRYNVSSRISLPNVVGSVISFVAINFSNNVQTRFSLDADGNQLSALSHGTNLSILLEAKSANRTYVATWASTLYKVSALSADGTSVLWGISTPAATWESLSIIADADDNLYVAVRLSGTYKTVLAKFDPNGNVLWKVQLTVSATVGFTPISLALDGIGGIYLMGNLESYASVLAMKTDGSIKGDWLTGVSTYHIIIADYTGTFTPTTEAFTSSASAATLDPITLTEASRTTTDVYNVVSYQVTKFS